MTEATTQALLSVLRSLLIVGGSWLTTNGYLSGGNVDQLIGVVMVLVPLFWGVIQKYSAERKAKAREVVAVNVGIVVADSTFGATTLPPAVAVPVLIETIAPMLPVAKETP